MFRIFAQNIFRGYTLESLSEAVLTSTHDLCFMAKIRKNNVYPCKPQFYYIKVRCKGVYITRTCLHDDVGWYINSGQYFRIFMVIVVALWLLYV